MQHDGLRRVRRLQIEARAGGDAGETVRRAEGVVGGGHQGAAQHLGRARVAAGTAKLESADAVLADAAGTGDVVADDEGAQPVHNQVTVVDDRQGAAEAAAGAPRADLQHAAVNPGLAGVAVGEVEDEGARAGLGQAAGVAVGVGDRGLDRQGAAGVVLMDHNLAVAAKELFFPISLVLNEDVVAAHLGGDQDAAGLQGRALFTAWPAKGEGQRAKAVETQRTGAAAELGTGTGAVVKHGRDIGVLTGGEAVAVAGERADGRAAAAGHRPAELRPAGAIESTMDGIATEDAIKPGISDRGGDGGIGVHQKSAAREIAARDEAQIEHGAGLTARAEHHRGAGIQGRAASDAFAGRVANEMEAATVEHQGAGDAVAAAGGVVEMQGTAALHAGGPQVLLISPHQQAAASGERDGAIAAHRAADDAGPGMIVEGPSRRGAKDQAVVGRDFDDAGTAERADFLDLGDRHRTGGADIDMHGVAERAAATVVKSHPAAQHVEFTALHGVVVGDVGRGKGPAVGPRGGGDVDGSAPLEGSVEGA